VPPTPHPTLRGVAALVAFVFVVVAAAVTGTPELTPLAIIIGLPLAVSPWLAHRRARQAQAVAELHAHIEPGAVEVGREMQLKLSVTNRSTRGPVLPTIGLPPIERKWRTRGPDPTPDRWVRWVAPPVLSLWLLPNPGPGRTESCLRAVPTGRRGVLELPPQRCWAHDPFGLFGAPGPVTPAVNAVVHPVPIHPGPTIVELSAAVMGKGAPMGSSGGSGLGDLEGIRPYVAGDRLSLLHWPAKARYGTWFVRHFGIEGTTAMPIVLDDRSGVHRRAEFERLVSAALWILDETMEEHHDVLLLTLSGRRHLLEPTERGRAEARLLLAEIQPVHVGSATRLIPVPTDAVVLTTQTGAERLTSTPEQSGAVRVTDQPSGAIAGGRRVVVV
jgi:uncharacterized protein (DUF58 family)